MSGNGAIGGEGENVENGNNRTVSEVDDEDKDEDVDEDVDEDEDDDNDDDCFDEDGDDDKCEVDELITTGIISSSASFESKSNQEAKPSHSSGKSDQIDKKPRISDPRKEDLSFPTSTVEEGKKKKKKRPHPRKQGEEVKTLMNDLSGDFEGILSSSFVALSLPLSLCFFVSLFPFFFFKKTLNA